MFIKIKVWERYNMTGRCYSGGNEPARLSHNKTAIKNKKMPRFWHHNKKVFKLKQRREEESAEWEGGGGATWVLWCVSSLPRSAARAGKCSWCCKRFKTCSNIHNWCGMKDLYLHPDIITSKFMLKTETVQAVCVIQSTDQLRLQGARFRCWTQTCSA